MNVDTMRAIDFWAGVPLTFLATGLVRVVEGRRRRPVRPQNILLVELSEMGSTILVDPAMQKLKREFGANLHFAIFAKNKPSLDLLRTVPEENIYTIRADGFSTITRDTLGFLAWTRQRRIDTVIDLELFSRFTALLTGLSGARNRVGFHRFTNEGLYRGEMLTHRVAYNPYLHISKNFIALVNALLAPNPEEPYSKTRVGDDEIKLGKTTVTDAAIAAMRAKITGFYPQFDPARQQLVLFNANASDLLPLRRWPQPHYIELARRVLDRHPHVVIALTGAPSERDGLQGIPDALQNPRCINMAGATTFAELPALYALASFMLTNDSGPGHFAAVTDMPTYVFFGPETPALYGSLGKTTPIYAGLACSPCVSAANHRKTVCKDNVCLQVITPDQVYEILRPALAVGVCP